MTTKCQEFITFSTTLIGEGSPFFPIIIFTDSSKIESLRKRNFFSEETTHLNHKVEFLYVDNDTYKSLFSFLIEHDEQISPCFDHLPLRIYFPEIYSEARKKIHITNDFGIDQKKTYEYFYQMKNHLVKHNCSQILVSMLNKMLDAISSDFLSKQAQNNEN